MQHDRARAYRIFLESLDLAPDRRPEFLQRACDGDVGLRGEVETLLDFSHAEDSRTQALFVPLAQHLDLSGSQIGRFRLSARIGEGGMGVVYRAARTDGVPQSVAIKLLPVSSSQADQARFQREARHLARLEHPAIARLIDAGVDQGRAWIAMEYVSGQRIDEYCAAQAADARRIAALVAQIAEAVAAAHRMLVVHSDIKPSNVLVTAEGAPKLIDFGISTALREAGAVAAETVGVGRSFSPGYAAPEQVSGGAVTVATDVFGLGALAYRLLTGAGIFPGAEEPIAYLQALSQRDVALPSLSAARGGKGHVDPAQLRGDLDAIVCKALERDPARRYPSVAELRDDLQAFLGHRPVQARRPSALYRCGRFLRRNRLAAALTALLVCLVGAGGASLAWQSHREALARDMAVQRGAFLESLLKSADPRNGRRDISVAELLDNAAAELDRKLGDEPLVEASMLGLIAETNIGLARYPEGLAASDRQLTILREAGGSPLELARARTTRGEILRDLGRWSDARSELDEAVRSLRGLSDVAQLCQALDELGAVQLRTQQEKEAEATFREELAIESRGGPDLQQRRQYPYRSLAIVLDEQGRYAEALDFARLAVELARRTLPADHPDLLYAETTYASALENMHRETEAEPILRGIIAAQTRVLGADHRNTLLSRLSLADLLMTLHRDAEAAALARPTAQALDRILGPDNIYTLGGWLIYGTAACNQHPDGEALGVLQRVAAARKRNLPAGSWFLYSTDVSVGQCLHRAGRERQAIAVLLPAVQGLESTRGAAFHRTQLGYALLRDAYQAAGDAREAARWAAKRRE